MKLWKAIAPLAVLSLPVAFLTAASGAESADGLRAMDSPASVASEARDPVKEAVAMPPTSSVPQGGERREMCRLRCNEEFERCREQMRERREFAREFECHDRRRECEERCRFEE
jgi:hypothetical protein